ncbi:HlyD family secretion protein [Xanthomonas euvesicatoria]|uniref:HlyD family secretion protein n=1 Tax=Xanthomonas euvesicatoria TaxID=456327 RepID=UPI000F8DC28F|nr:HlyD family efflux transporter periplasmic adaptor subunit [Xanthomonas euvesicatoria]
MELFRNEVFAAKKVDRLGGISVTPPRLGWVFFFSATLILLIMTGLALFGRYSRTEKIVGRLIPLAGQANVVAPQASGATVAEVLVSEGDQVMIGQPLVRVSSQRSSASSSDTGKLISAQIASKLQQLKASVESQQRLSLLKEHDLRDRIELLRARIATLTLQIKNQDIRYKAANALYENWRTKASGLVSGYQLAQQYDTALQQKSLAQDVRNQRLQAMLELNQSEAELIQLPHITGERIVALNVQIADVENEKAENEQRRSQVIHASIDGIVVNVLAHPGMVVDEASQLMVILPRNSKLVAELWAPSSAVGLLQVGKPVDISYDAFPAARYGRQRGKIISISTNAVSALEIGRILGSPQSSSGYRVIVAIDDASSSSFFRRFAAKPGMTLTAKVDVETRSLIDWMLRPFALPSLGSDEKATP